MLRFYACAAAIATGLCFSSASAQSVPTSQTPPAKATAPSEFRSAEGNFRVMFPGTPKATTGTETLSNVPTDYHQYLLGKGGVVYLVSYIDYARELTTAKQVKAFFEQVKDQQSAGGQKLVDDSEVSVDGLPGREFVTEDADSRLVTREFLIGRRLYKLIVGVKLPVQSPATNKTALTAFFDSFHLIDKPADRTAYAREGDDDVTVGSGLRGSVEGDLYRNDLLSMTMNLPAGWQVVNDEQFAYANNRGQRSAGQPGINESIDRSLKSTANLVAVSKYMLGTARNATMVVSTERLSDLAAPAQAIAAGSLEAMKSELPLRVTKEVNVSRIGGVEFASFSTALDLPDGVFRQSYYVTNRRGQALTVVFSYVYDDDEQAMLRSLLSLRFALH